MTNPRSTFLHSVIVIVITLITISCTSEQSVWEDSVEQNTLVAYELFIAKYPESNHIAEAKVIIEDIFWNEALQGNTSASYDLYQKKYPGGKYSSIAIQKKEVALWEEIQRGVDCKVLKDFIVNYPENAYLSEVKEKLEICLWEKAIKKDKYSDYKNYLKEFPEGSKVEQAKERLEDSYWKLMSRKKSKLSTYSFNLLTYLKEYPNGKYKDEARRLLKAANKEFNTVKIYTNKGCGRCKFALNYLKRNNISYTEIKTDKIKNQKLMWKEIKRSKKRYGKSIKMPVIKYKNDCFFNIPDLESRLDIIKYYSKMSKEDKALLKSLKSKVKRY
jgi:glutaredoxin